MTDTAFSTFERPSMADLRRFRPAQLGDDTIRLYLTKGYSLVICCRRCGRHVEWTPPRLLELYGDKLDLKLNMLIPRLSCGGQFGCGGRDIALLPHFYDHPWSWPPKLL